jgi:hypothetical protein
VPFGFVLSHPFARKKANGWGTELVLIQVVKNLANEGGCRPGRSQQPVVKVEKGKNHPPGAKARLFLSAICGTAEAVPFQNRNNYLCGGHHQPLKLCASLLLIRPERIASPEAVILNEAQRSEGSAVVLSPSSVATQ